MKRIIIIAIVLLSLSSCISVLKAVGLTDPPATKGGTIEQGMSKAKVIDEWGEPYRINRSTSAYGVTERWVYVSRRYSGNHPRYYLYFRNGTLEGWHERR